MDSMALHSEGPEPEAGRVPVTWHQKLSPAATKMVTVTHRTIDTRTPVISTCAKEPSWPVIRAYRSRLGVLLDAQHLASRGSMRGMIFFFSGGR